MKKRSLLLLSLTGLIIACAATVSQAHPITLTAKEVGQTVIAKFGRGAAGKTATQVGEKAAAVAAKHGDEALPILRKAGHAGFEAFEKAGPQGSKLVSLYNKHGDDAIWLIGDAHKLDLFLKYGEQAASALIKHPKAADMAIVRFGQEGAAAINILSKEGAQQMSALMVAKGGAKNVFEATRQSKELLPVIIKYGDAGMDFIWKNKKSLTFAAALGLFLKDPGVYISGVKQLVVEPVVAPVTQSINWGLLLFLGLFVVFMPKITTSILRSRNLVKEDKAKQLQKEAATTNTQQQEVPNGR